jgi:SAM-dependent methyltransferase
VPFLAEAYASLQRQTTAEEWEWLLLENNGGVVPEDIRKDARVRIGQTLDSGIGRLKRRLCLSARGTGLVELDADDLLAPEALSKIAAAFASGADFVYSDAADFRHESWLSRWDNYPYGARYGWRHYDVDLFGHPLVAMHSPPATAHNLRRVEWSPNHVRAWTLDSYEAVGGHDASMAVADDHDLSVRYYLAGKKFLHVPECLYGYRVHGQNTVATRNAEIQRATNDVYNRYLWRLAETWTRRAGLLLVDLCGGIDPVQGYTPLDRSVPAGGIACDLEARWPLQDDSVGLLRASDAVEHLRDPVHTMNEAFRVLAPGGWLMIEVPSTNGAGAFCDPTHKSFWNELSFRYYTDRRFARYVPEFRGRFQVSRVQEHFPSDWHREHHVPYTEAHLIALKAGYEPMGEVLW